LRTNIDINDELMAEALRRSGLQTKKAVVEEALRLLVELRQHEDLRALRGKIHWEGNLDEMREGRTFGMVEPA
jgi:Arc/MetJ family transcription regulator